jgi:hypothetical protein
MTWALPSSLSLSLSLSLSGAFYYLFWQVTKDQIKRSGWVLALEKKGARQRVRL